MRGWIGERVVDIGLATEANPGGAATPLLDDERVAVCAADDPPVREAPLTAATLAGERMKGSRARSWARAGLG